MQDIHTGSPPVRQDQPPAVLLRIQTVMKITGLGRSTIYRLIANHEFPSPVRLTTRAVAWRSSDINTWTEARPAAAH